MTRRFRRGRDGEFRDPDDYWLEKLVQQDVPEPQPKLPVASIPRDGEQFLLFELEKRKESPDTTKEL